MENSKSLKILSLHFTRMHQLTKNPHSKLTVDNHGWIHDHHHQKVWEGARFTTRRFDGVQRDLVVANIYITTPLPIQEMKPSTPMTKPWSECHSGFIGGYWYLQEHYNAMIRKTSLGILRCHSVQTLKSNREQ